jgi:hypothetical protein
LGPGLAAAGFDIHAFSMVWFDIPALSSGLGIGRLSRGLGRGRLFK